MVKELMYDSVSEYEYVNAHINNISFPKTIEQLEEFIYEHGCYNVEDVINELLTVIPLGLYLVVALLVT